MGAALGIVFMSGCGGSKAESTSPGDTASVTGSEGAAGSSGKALVAGAAPKALSSGELTAGVKAPATAQPTPAAELASAGGNLEMPSWAHGKVINSIPVKAGDKVFALTFDDGPWPESTRQILRVLKDNNVKATFFMVGQEVSRRPQVAREVLAQGHAIGNHSWDHPSRPRDPIMQVQKTNEQIKKVIGYTPTIFRPPYGILAGMAHEAEREGDPVFLWSADSVDWSRPGVEKIVSRILNQARPGGISLMHDGGGNRSQSVAALPLIIQGLKARGYTLVTIPELLQHRDLTAAFQSPEPSKSHSKRKKKGKKRGKHHH